MLGVWWQLQYVTQVGNYAWRMENISKINKIILSRELSEEMHICGKK